MELYRIQAEGAVYFVTYTIVDWLPVFVSGDACQIVTDSLTFCHAQKGLRINSFVIMPTHMHAIVFHETYKSEPLRTALGEFRRFTGHELSKFCETRCPPCFAEALERAAGSDRDRRFWQPSRHPEVIETERFWEQKFNYLHENPCRKGLVRRAAEWRYSSAAYVLSDGRESCDVPISAIAW
jgi:putative transposase